MKKTLVDLRKWRDELTVDSLVLTRDNRKDIVSKIRSDDKWQILIGKGHEVKISKDDLFPLDWKEMVEDWRHRKSTRKVDIELI